ncbi:DUF6880 family protein [Phenylobacterium sp.]|jgi:hypothetical protein|uniref:DUF6880 family protein n=1 Tax=Phenylobacterium sp. TaxID=1871053 RepID=UPI002E377D7E|nr:DUF6880 family protein [Phenylobacterium sp.]HEX2561047.1 hypothetical protein [Phenylobacterium sp.]
MKRPTAASLKKVTPENLARLGAERLAEILVGAAQARPELKRRLRMELAAEQGADHLVVEIDRRLATLESSRSRVSWRQRNTFVRDLKGLRDLIAGRLAELDGPAARDRLFQFLQLAPRIRTRVRDADGQVAETFAHAARDLSRLAESADVGFLAGTLAQQVALAPVDWAQWLPLAVDGRPELAEATLRRLSDHPAFAASWLPSLRALADASGNVDAYRATFTPAELATQPVAAEVGARLLAAGRVDEAGEVLQAAPATSGRKGAAPLFAWESAWVEYLERSGQTAAAQAALWASFERTLSVERARAFIARLGGFDDVEAEARAFALAAGRPDFTAGLQFLIDWPALPEAARMILNRRDDAEVAAELAELWAGRLRARFPEAAELLLRKAAAAAFRRRDFATCDRLTAEADSIPL